MKRTMIQRQVWALSVDLLEISEALRREEADARMVAKRNIIRREKGEGEPLPYLVTPLGYIKQELEFVDERLRSTISALGVSFSPLPAV